jgi:hypothetical protein
MVDCNKIILILIIFCLIGNFAIAQSDSLPVIITNTGDAAKKLSPRSTVTTPIYNPRKAIIRSAIIPGWGQVYNKKAWKLPFVYAALGTPAYLFFRNLKQYKEAREAYRLAVDGDPSNDWQIKQPYYNVKDQPERIRVFRNQVRQNIDYCVLFFLLAWGANVADAAVDAHLKTFDVSDDLSLYFKAGYSPMANTSGVSLVLAIGK